ncbi:MAG: 4Fe-4S dicluster domain-containing protein [Planctomycetia bacterium]|nr:4Fe-4S dicluster domain-containing protein [Planctomycetia bacterium]
MLRKLRILMACVSFLLVTLLFLDFTGTIHLWFGWLAKIQFLPALLAVNVGVMVGLILLTLLFGRIYCSVICPLGILQDIFSWFAGKSKRFRFQFKPEKTVLRYGFLVVFVVLLLVGCGQIAAFLAPYSAFGRIVSTLLSPIYLLGNNALAYLAERAESYAFYRVDIWFKSVTMFLTATFTLLLVGILAWRSGRVYCNTVCPVGTILGFFSRFSLWKPTINTEKCNGCGLCARNCKSSCINPATHRIDTSRCVACFDCLETCRQHAIEWKIGGKPRTENITENITENVETTVETVARRGFLMAVTLTALQAGRASAQNSGQKTENNSGNNAGNLSEQKSSGTKMPAHSTSKTDGGLAEIIDKVSPRRVTPITPPGSEGIRHLARHCTACQLCVTVCPNQVLRPSKNGKIFQMPEMSYERGYCRPECVRCSQVCPTGAIQLLDVATKSATHIGQAVWVRESCVVMTDHVNCGNCERHCPTKAIQMIPSDPKNPDSLKIPAIDPARCIGCGACENLCPVRPVSAIYVEGVERHHLE